MQYGFYINQKAMVDLRELTGVKLDHSHAAIVSFIKDFAGTGELETRIIDKKLYYWLSYAKIAEEMPLYDWQKDTIYRKMKQLVEAKILEHYYDERQQKAFYGFGINYIYIVKPIEVPISRRSENNPKGVGLKSVGGTENNPYNHNTIHHTTSLEKIGETEIFKNSVDDWQPSEQYQQAIERVSPNLTEDDYQAELLTFRDHHRKHPPENLDKAWMTWCRIAENNAYGRKLQKTRTEEADQLAKQRIQEFHAKKQENIQKVGTAHSKYPPKKEIFKPRPLDYSSREEFYRAIEHARAKGKIVEPDQISTTAERIWGEHTVETPEIQKLASKFTADYHPEVDMEARKNQILNQFQS